MQGKYDRQRKWKAQHKTTIRFDLYENNKIMIDWLNSQPSMAGYIKSLILADMHARGINSTESFLKQDQQQESGE